MSEQFQVVIVNDPQNLVVEINNPVSPDIEVTVAPDPTAVVVELDNGIVGPQGPAGPGVAVGGTTGQVLVKASNANYDTQWVTDPGFSAITALTGDVTATGPGSANATLSAVGNAGTYTKVTTDSKGRVISGTGLSSTDIPGLPASIIISGVLGIAFGGTGRSTIGSVNQILGVAAGGTSLEYKTIIAGSGIAISNAPNSVTIDINPSTVIGLANDTLSNLAAPTAINQNLIPASSGVYTLGAGAEWLNVYTQAIGVSGDTRYDVLNGLFKDNGLNIVLDLNNYTMKYGGITVLDWGTGVLADTSGTQSIVWSGRYLTDASGAFSLDWANRQGFDPSNVMSFDYSGRQLFDSSTNSSISWESRELYDLSGLTALSYSNRFLYDNATIKSVDWNARVMYDHGGNATVDWEVMRLFQNGNLVIDWGASRIYSLSTVLSIDADQRQLRDNTGGLVADWSATNLYVANNLQASGDIIGNVARVQNVQLQGTAGTGLVDFPLQSIAPSTPVSGFRLYADSSNRLAWRGANGFIRTFDATAITANQTYTLPNASGTVALTSNLASYVLKAGDIMSGTLNLPTLQISAITQQSASQSFSALVIDSATGTVRTAPVTTGLQPVIENTLTTPPVSPNAGDSYLIPAGATGAWSGQTNKIATWSGSAWTFYTPTVNDQTTVLTGTNAGKTYVFNGSTWVLTTVTVSAWQLNGNTVGSLKTLGTLDSFDLPIVTGAVERMRVTATGRLGIGTTSPGTLLDVNGVASFGQSSASTAQVIVRGGAAGQPMWQLQRTAGVTTTFSFALASGGLSISDDVNSQVVANFFGNTTANQLFLGQQDKIVSDSRTALLSATTFSSSAGSNLSAGNLVIQAGMGTGTGNPGDLVFNTGAGQASGSTQHVSTTRMTLKANSGNLGIGVANPVARVVIGGNVSTSAWSTNGIQLQLASTLYTDNSSTGTVATNMVNVVGQPTLASTNSGVTYTDAATMYFTGAPAAGTNVTLTNRYTGYSNAGTWFFGGQVAAPALAGSQSAGDRFVFQNITGGNTGKLAIGSSAVNQFYIQAYGTSANPKFDIFTTASTTAPTMSFNQGLVVVGTGAGGVVSGTSATFEVLANGGGPGLRVGFNNNTTSGYYITDTNAGTIYCGNAGTASQNPRAQSTSAALTVYSGAVTYFTADTGLTAGGTYTPTERMRVHSNGFIGIGTNAPAARLSVAAGISTAAWGLNGAQFATLAGNVNDSSSSGAVASNAVNAFATPNLTATNVVTYSNAATVYIAGAPTAGTNVTINNPLSLWVNAGRTRLNSLSVDTTYIQSGAGSNSFVIGAGGVGNNPTMSIRSTNPSVDALNISNVGGFATVGFFNNNATSDQRGRIGWDNTNMVISAINGANLAINAPIATLTQDNLTGSASTSALSIVANWNTTGSPNLISASVTNTAALNPRWISFTAGTSQTQLSVLATSGSIGEQALFATNGTNSVTLGVGNGGATPAGTNYLRINSVTAITFSTSTVSVPVGTLALSATGTVTGANSIYGQQSAGTAITALRIGPNTPSSGALTMTTGDQIDVRIGGFNNYSFAPTSGTATYTQFSLTPTINQTGGANGITRSIHINPTITAAADYRAIEVVNGSSFFGTSSGGVAVGTSSLNASAQVQMDSTTRGFLPPRMTTAQRTAITSPATGLMVYDTDLACPCFYDGTGWRKISHSPA